MSDVDDEPFCETMLKRMMAGNRPPAFSLQQTACPARRSMDTKDTTDNTDNTNDMDNKDNKDNKACPARRTMDDT